MTGNIGDDGQEQYDGTEEEVAGQWMVTVVMAVGTYPDHDSHQDGVPHQESIHLQHLPSHELIEVCQCSGGAIRIWCFIHYLSKYQI